MSLQRNLRFSPEKAVETVTVLNTELGNQFFLVFFEGGGCGGGNIHFCLLLFRRELICFSDLVCYSNVFAAKLLSFDSFILKDNT